MASRKTAFKRWSSGAIRRQAYPLLNGGSEGIKGINRSGERLGLVCQLTSKAAALKGDSTQHRGHGGAIKEAAANHQ